LGGRNLGGELGRKRVAREQRLNELTWRPIMVPSYIVEYQAGDVVGPFLSWDQVVVRAQLNATAGAPNPMKRDPIMHDHREG